MKAVSLVSHTGGGMESRFYADGRRITREQFEDMKDRAESLDCFWTKAKPMANLETGDRTYRRKNGCRAWV